MDVLKFKSVSNGVETFRIYPISSIRSVVHTVASNGSETLVIQFDSRSETTRNKKDIKKILSKLDVVDANANEVKQLIEDRKDQVAAQEKVKKEHAKRREEARQKRIEARKAEVATIRKTPSSKKKVTEKKVTKKKVSKKAKKKTKKIHKKKLSKKKKS